MPKVVVELNEHDLLLYTTMATERGRTLEQLIADWLDAESMKFCLCSNKIPRCRLCSHYFTEPVPPPSHVSRHEVIAAMSWRNPPFPPMATDDTRVPF